MLSSSLVPLVAADPAAILHVSLPEGTTIGPNPEPWLNEGWLLEFSSTQGTFTLRINNTSEAKRSYDTRIVIVLNDIGYNNLESLIIDSTPVPKSAFKYGTPTPYNMWTWPNDVYPAWFNDTLVNIGTIERKGFRDVTVSVIFSNVDGARMHFDAWGKKVTGTPTVGDITHSPNSEDSTVLFHPGPRPIWPPIPDFSYNPPYPNTGEMVTFDASTSYDPDGGTIVSYSWDFGDDTPIVIEADPITTHAYATFGSFTVNLTVTDDETQTASKTRPVDVRQHPVALFIFSPIDPLEGELVTFDASSSSADGGSIVSYEWDFGDGSPHVVETDPVTTHVYTTYGTYTVTLNVTDSEGKWDTEPQPITVERVPIADFFWLPTYPQVDETVTFDASVSTPDGGTIIRYEWDFGDGTPRVIETDPITTHVYTTYGTFTVTLNVTDSEGRWDTRSRPITVRALPHADFTWSPLSPQAGEQVTFDGSLSTPDGGTIVSYEWNFGDGSPKVKELDPITTHTYSTYGTYTVTLNVTDSEGKWNTRSATITVGPAPPGGPNIDVYTQQEPYSGRGPNAPSDAFAPQGEVTLYAFVYYSYSDPVQGKIVAFEVYDSTGVSFLYRTDDSDENGIATTTFRIPSAPPFGIWTAISTVEVAGRIIQDTVTFEVGWIVEIAGAETTDSTGAPQMSFAKGTQIYLNLTVVNIALVQKIATITVVIYDEAGVPIGQLAIRDLAIPSGTSHISISLPIPNWAFVGVGSIHVNAYTDLPQLNGTPYCPELSTTFLVTKP